MAHPATAMMRLGARQSTRDGRSSPRSRSRQANRPPSLPSAIEGPVQGEEYACREVYFCGPARFTPLELPVPCHLPAMPTQISGRGGTGATLQRRHARA